MTAFCERVVILTWCCHKWNGQHWTAGCIRHFEVHFISTCLRFHFFFTPKKEYSENSGWRDWRRGWAVNENMKTFSEWSIRYVRLCLDKFKSKRICWRVFFLTNLASIPSSPAWCRCWDSCSLDRDNRSCPVKWVEHSLRGMARR